MECIKYDENGAPVAICHELATARSRISELDAKIKEYEEDNTGLSEAATKLCARIDSLETVIETQAQRIVELTKALRDLRIEMMHNAALPDHQEWADAFEIINKSLAE